MRTFLVGLALGGLVAVSGVAGIATPAVADQPSVVLVHDGPDWRRDHRHRHRHWNRPTYYRPPPPPVVYYPPVYYYPPPPPPRPGFSVYFRG